MSVRLYVGNRIDGPGAVETATEDDFMFFRDSVHLALEDGEVVELLLNSGADPNGEFRRRGIIDFESRTCLIAAMPHVDIVSMLLQAGADPNRPSTWGEDCATETPPLAHARDNPALARRPRSHGAR